MHDRFRSNVRYELESNGWSQRDLADKLSCSESQVSQVLSGYRNPSLETVAAYAIALGCEFSDLIN